MRRFVVPILLLLAALALGGAAIAENFVTSAKSGIPGQPNVLGSGDFTDAQTAAYRTAIAVVDTQTTAGVLAVDEFVLRGRQILIVSPRFSVSGANCKIRVVYVHKTDTSYGASATSTTINKIKGYSDERTVTAGTGQFEGAYYAAPDEYYDGEGAIAVRVLVTQAPSSGTVTFWVGSK